MEKQKDLLEKEVLIYPTHQLIMIQNQGQIFLCFRHRTVWAEPTVMGPNGKVVCSQAHFLTFSVKSVSVLFLVKQIN